MPQANLEAKQKNLRITTGTAVRVSVRTPSFAFLHFLVVLPFLGIPDHECVITHSRITFLLFNCVRPYVRQTAGKQR